MLVAHPQVCQLRMFVMLLVLVHLKHGSPFYRLAAKLAFEWYLGVFSGSFRRGVHEAVSDEKGSPEINEIFFHMCHNYKLESEGNNFIRVHLSNQAIWLVTSHLLLFRPLFFVCPLPTALFRLCTFMPSFCDSSCVTPASIRSFSAGNWSLQPLSQCETPLGLLSFFNSCPTSFSWETASIVCSCMMWAFVFLWRVRSEFVMKPLSHGPQ